MLSLWRNITLKCMALVIVAVALVMAVAAIVAIVVPSLQVLAVAVAVVVEVHKPQRRYRRQQAPSRPPRASKAVGNYRLEGRQRLVVAKVATSRKKTTSAPSFGIGSAQLARYMCVCVGGCPKKRVDVLAGSNIRTNRVNFLFPPFHYLHHNFLHFLLLSFLHLYSKFSS